jgi:uncharacterized protein (DUF433 family)
MQSHPDGHIEASPGYRGGKPRIAGTRITVSDIVLMHLRLGQSIEEIAARYGLSLAGVYAAMVFYYDHQAEIDRSIDQEEAYVEAARGANPSLLQAKLKALNGV